MTTVMVLQAEHHGLGELSDVRTRRPASSDTEALLEMVGRCSRTSLLHRFHGYTDGADYFAALLQHGATDHTLLAWSGSACIGVATLGVGGSGGVDLGVLVEDAWQRRGVGTRLVASLLGNARSNGVTAVHADVLGDDRFILELLRRIGPLSVAIEFGSYSIDIDIGIPSDGHGNGDDNPVRLPLLDEPC